MFYEYKNDNINTFFNEVNALSPEEKKKYIIWLALKNIINSEDYLGNKITKAFKIIPTVNIANISDDKIVSSIIKIFTINEKQIWNNLEKEIKAIPENEDNFKAKEILFNKIVNTFYKSGKNLQMKEDDLGPPLPHPRGKMF